MEDKKIHPSLPSNYVTLAQLQERWLKEKERERERQQREKEQQEQEKQKLQQKRLEENRERQNKSQRRPPRVHLIHGDDVRSGTRNRNAKQDQLKIKDDSDNNQPAVKASCENREKLKDKAEGGVQNAEQMQDSKSKKSKRKWQKANKKPRAGKEVAGITDCDTGVTMEGDNGVKNMNVIRGDEKEEIKSELNDKNDGLVEEVEEKIGDLSINGGKGEENGRVRRPYNGFRGPHRNYGGGSFEYRPHPPRRGYLAARKHKDDKMVWVKKGGSSEGGVGGTEIAGGS